MAINIFPRAMGRIALNAVLLLMTFTVPGVSADTRDDTMLMFVGEDVSVVTLASRKPESPKTAPAIVSVVTAEEISQKGYQTLADLLSREPGFFMLSSGSGSVPYLRGIPDSVLFLYDGVPMSEGGTRNLNFLDRDLSLTGVKRVEIIRGPGSVLWGADAFAGIVNIVPMTGIDQPGSRVSFYTGTDSLRGGSCSWGGRKKNWTLFLNAETARENFHDNQFRVQTQGDSDNAVNKLYDSKYLETSFNAALGDALSFSGRLSDFTRNYTMHDSGDLSWEGVRTSPSGYLKGVLKRPVGQFNFTASGYYSSISNDIKKVDLEQDQESSTWHSEIIVDTGLFDTGLVTAGLSYRNMDLKGGVVNEDFLPQYLKPENLIYLPGIEQSDYIDRMSSVFAQYRDRFAKIHWWAGARLDNHSIYGSSTSLNLGFNFSISDAWQLKAGFGTAYRTPYSAQIFGNDSFEPEGVETCNVQLAWSPGRMADFALTSFYSKLTDHVQYDPYGGLSKPFGQETTGFEFSGRIKPTDSLEFKTGITLISSWGDSAEYKLESTYYGPGGIERPEYEIWQEPFDLAADYMLNLGASWRFISGCTGTVSLNKTSPISYSYDKGNVSGEYSSPIFVGVVLRMEGILIDDLDITFAAENIFDKDSLVPGAYGPTHGKPFSMVCTMSYSF